MLSKIHHVGIVVKSADEALKFYRDALGLSVSADRVIEDQGVRGVLLPMGASEIELLEPTRDGTGVAKFLEARGEGMHHVCFESDDCAKELDAAAAKGIELIDKVPRPGLAGMVGFLHPKSNCGALVEFATPIEKQHAAAAGGFFKRIDHLAIVVKDLEQGTQTFERNFGLARNPAKGGANAALGMINTYVPIGDADLEILQPVTETGPIATFAKDRGEGLFLLSVEVSNTAAAVEHLRSLGARAGDPGPTNVAFVSMKSTHGVNLQLVQR
jgi:methylmalonyl-CoA epimerase